MSEEAEAAPKNARGEEVGGSQVIRPPRQEEHPFFLLLHGNAFRLLHDKTPPFVPKRRGPKSKGKKTSEGMKVGGVIHRRVPTAALQSGPQSRRGRPVSLRGRCVCCYANAPQPMDGSRKKLTRDGSCIPQTSFACDVCRVLLCKSCFWNVHDHRQRGVVNDFVHFR